MSVYRIFSSGDVGPACACECIICSALIAVDVLCASSLCVCVCVFMALITTQVLCARSQNSVMSVSVRRVHVVLSTAGFKGGGKP